MGQAIEQGRCQGRVPKDLGPVRKAKIRRNDDRSSLVAFRHDMEKQFSTFTRKRHIAEFVYDEQAKPGIALHESTESFAFPGLDQFVGQAASRDKACRDPLAAGFNSKSCRHVRFPRPSFAKEDDVAMVLDIVAAGQFPEQPSVQARDRFGIEVLQGLDALVLGHVAGNGDFDRRCRA